MSRQDGRLGRQNAGDTRLHDDARMQAILDSRSMFIVYQPIVLHGPKRVFACEALSRPHWQGEPVAPQAWFQWAAQSGRMVEADLLAFRLAVQGMSIWHPSFRELPLFVNVLPSSLTRREFFRGMERVLSQSRLHPGQLVIEIVESVSYEPAVLRQVIRQLGEFGIRVALDDVGTGSAGLSALVDLEPHFIKVDRSLIQGIAQSDARRKMLHLLVEYMGSGNHIVAEGIETQEDLQAVADAGVALSQGYLWCRPEPPDMIHAFMERFAAGAEG